MPAADQSCAAGPRMLEALYAGQNHEGQVAAFSRHMAAPHLNGMNGALAGPAVEASPAVRAQRSLRQEQDAAFQESLKV